MTPLSYYKILGIPETASKSEIRSAYKSAKNNPIDEKTRAKAYEILSDSKKRKEYDRTRSEHISEPSNLRLLADKKVDVNEISQIIRDHIEYNDSKKLDQVLSSILFENRNLIPILRYACGKGKLDIVKHLMKHSQLSARLKRDIFQENIPCHKFKGSFFEAAIDSGSLELVKYLLEKCKLGFESQGFKDAALIRAVELGHEDIIKYLILKGANVNADASSTMLGSAIESGKLSVVKLLVEAGTKVNDPYHLEMALSKGSLEIVKYFYQTRPSSKVCEFSSAHACLVVNSGNIELIKYLESEGVNFFKTDPKMLMFSAMRSSNFDMMRFFLDERGMNEKISNNPQFIESLLEYAVRRKDLNSNKSEEEKALKVVQFLLQERKFTLPSETLEKLILDTPMYKEVASYLLDYLEERYRFLIPQTITKEIKRSLEFLRADTTILQRFKLDTSFADLYKENTMDFLSILASRLNKEILFKDGLTGKMLLKEYDTINKLSVYIAEHGMESVEKLKAKIGKRRDFL